MSQRETVLRKLAKTFAFVGAAIPVGGLLLSYVFAILNEGTPFGTNHWTYFPFYVSVMPFYEVFFLIPSQLLNTKSPVGHIFRPVFAAGFSVFYYYLFYFTVLLLGSLFFKERGACTDDEPKS